MSVTVVLGMQWGDEAKGKIVDMISKDYDYIVRFNGGDNAGHTIKHNGKKFGLHLTPSGIFYPEKIKVIGNGVVINPDTLLKELAEVEAAGFSMKNLVISDSAHIILPWHRDLDGIEDARNGIGTTKKGIGPVYMDKASRTQAIRVGDLLDETGLKEKLTRIARLKEAQLKAYRQEKHYDEHAIFDSLMKFKAKMGNRIQPTAYLLNEAIAKKKNVLLEGAQAVALDVDHGTYPFVTSSNTTAGAACTSSGIPPSKISRVIGVVKAYTTRVGNGPFPTELTDALGERIRQKGAEFGTTTGRPRRCGWLDLVMLQYACMINGVDELALMKVDVLDGLEEIKVAVGYELEGKRTDQFPTSAAKLQNAKPVYKTFKGWGTLPAEQWQVIKKTRKLPPPMQDYVAFIARESGVPVSMLSFGPEREQTVVF